MALQAGRGALMHRCFTLAKASIWAFGSVWYGRNSTASLQLITEPTLFFSGDLGAGSGRPTEKGRHFCRPYSCSLRIQCADNAMAIATSGPVALPAMRISARTIAAWT